MPPVETLVFRDVAGGRILADPVSGLRVLEYGECSGAEGYYQEGYSVITRSLDLDLVERIARCPGCGHPQLLNGGPCTGPCYYCGETGEHIGGVWLCESHLAFASPERLRASTVARDRLCRFCHEPFLRVVSADGVDFAACAACWYYHGFNGCAGCSARFERWEQIGICDNCERHHCTCDDEEEESERENGFPKIADAGFATWTSRRYAGLELEVSDYDGYGGGAWEVGSDSSLSGPNPREVRTFPARGDRLREVVEQVTEMLADSAINTSCGLHVHVDATGVNLSVLWQFYYTVYPVIGDMLPPSRRDNHYCQFPGRRDNRYSALNIEAAHSEHGTVEWRCHQGARRFSIIWPWVQFVTLFTERATRPILDGPIGYSNRELLLYLWDVLRPPYHMRRWMLARLRRHNSRARYNKPGRDR